MPLQTTGAISLGNIQTEFGGVNPISISEYVKGGSYVPNTTTNATIKDSLLNMKFSDYYGGSVINILDSQVVHVGYLEVPTTSEGITTYAYYYGYGGIPTPVSGSISDGTSNLYGGASILQISSSWNYETTLQFRVNGAVSNSGWNNMIIEGVAYSRASASFTSGGNSTWTWNLGIIPWDGARPFAASVGTNSTVTWN
jgi:hypothetical protein